MNLQIDRTTWFFFILTMVLWAASARLAGERAERLRLGWRTIPLSIFGFAWLGFGVDFIFRFLCLTCDPELFRVTLYPPGLFTPEVLARTWLVLGIFWVTLCIGYAAMLTLMGGSTPTWLIPVYHFNSFASMERIRLLDKIFIISCILTPLVDYPWVPRSLVTPIGLIIALFVIPLTISWQLYFQGQRVGMRRFIYMLPGLIIYFVSSYRTHLLLILLCISLPALLFKHRIAFYKIVTGVILFLIISTTITDTRRAAVWETKDKYARESFAVQWEMWQSDAELSPWIKLAKRFHGFDSTVVTVSAVPSFFHYSNRNIFAEVVMGAFVPRLLLDTKPDKTRGREFSVSIWALSERGLSKRSAAMIAPSITGDLYGVHGIPMIIFGGFIFGLVVGFLEKIRHIIGSAGQCLIVTIFGLTVALGLETDFVQTVASVLQRFIILYVAGFLLSHVQISPSVKIVKLET